MLKFVAVALLVVATSLAEATSRHNSLFIVPAAAAPSRPLNQFERVESLSTAFAPRIVGGKNVTSGGAPYQIALYRNNTYHCGGSLIGARSVLTAATCVYGSESLPTLFKVRYGSLKLGSGFTEVNVTKIVRHPSYSASTTDYDLAVLTLGLSITPGVNAGVISLANGALANNSAVNVTGWGRLSVNGVNPVDLQLADTLKVVVKADCQKKWGTSVTISDRMLCAHSLSQATCNGDSGSPLTVGGLLYGVVSWGASTCLHATYPNVFVNVTSLRTWILGNL